MGRIGEIRNRLDGGPVAPAGTVGAVGPVGGAGNGAIGTAAGTLGLSSSTAFDPFGAVYQQTMAANGLSNGTGAFNGGTSGIGSKIGATSTEQYPAGGTGATGGAMNPYGHQVGGFGSMSVPPALAAHGNGKVPRDALTPIGQGGHVLYAPAATSFQAMRAAAARDGLELKITDSYRTYDQQVELAARKGLSKNGGWAAVPGTSNHGWGLAVDANVNDPKMFAWLQQHGHEYGWVQEASREPWHWEFRPDQAR